MNDADILAGITVIFRDVFDDAAIVVTAATTPDDVAEWDSLRAVLLLAALEERFRLRFTTTEMDRISGVGDILDVLRGKLRG
jgi:acyl carrier protein